MRTYRQGGGRAGLRPQAACRGRIVLSGCLEIGNLALECQRWRDGEEEECSARCRTQPARCRRSPCSPCSSRTRRRIFTGSGTLEFNSCQYDHTAIYERTSTAAITSLSLLSRPRIFVSTLSLLLLAGVAGSGHADRQGG